MVKWRSSGLPRHAAASILDGSRWWLGNFATSQHVPILVQASLGPIPRWSPNLSEIWRSPWSRNCLARHFALSSPKRDLKSSALKEEEEEEEDDDDENDEVEGNEDENELEDEGEEDLESGSEEEEVVVIDKKEKKPKLLKRESAELQGRVLNQEIKAKIVRLILEGKEHKIVSREEALAYARKQNMDLVQVDGKSNPPVCKVFNFHKEEYKQEQIQKDRKKKRGDMVRLEEVKELRFTSKTELKDLTMKVQKAKEFLEYGHRVKFVAVSKGEILTKISEIQQEKEELVSEDTSPAKVSFSERRRKAELEKKEREAAFLRKRRREADIANMLDQVTPLMEDIAYIEQGPRIEGNQGWVLFRHVKSGKVKKKAPKPKPEAELAGLVEEASHKLEEQNNAYHDTRDDVPVPPQMEKPSERVPSPLSKIPGEKPTPVPISYWLGRVQEAKASGKGQTFGGTSATSTLRSQAPQAFAMGMPGTSTQVPQSFGGLAATLIPKSKEQLDQALQGFLDSAPLQSPQKAGQPLRSRQILPKVGLPAQQMQPPSNVRGIFPQNQPGSSKYPGSLSNGPPGMEKVPVGQVPSQGQGNPPVNKEGYSMPPVQGPGRFQGPQTYCPPPPRGRGFSPQTQQGHPSPPNPLLFPGGVLNQAGPPPVQVSKSAPSVVPPDSHTPEESPIYDFFRSPSEVQQSSPGPSRNTPAFPGALSGSPRAPQSSQGDTPSPLGYPPQEGLPLRPVPSPLGYPPKQQLPPPSVPPSLGYPPRPNTVPPLVKSPPQAGAGRGYAPSPPQSVPSPLGYPPLPHPVPSTVGYPPQPGAAPSFTPAPLGYPPKPGLPAPPAPPAGYPHYQPQQGFSQRPLFQQSPRPGDAAAPHDRAPPGYWPRQASTIPESLSQQQQIQGYSPISDNTPENS